MRKSAVFTEVRSSIPTVDLSRLESSEGKAYEELLAVVPEINLIEARNQTAATVSNEMDVLCWNAERGRFVLEGTPLPPADIYLLNEMDAGMARTGNVHTVRALAARCRLNYAFAIEFLELTKGEPEERKAPGDNELGFHGNAILSAIEIKEPRLLRLDGGSQWLDDEQKRIGSRIALICHIASGAGAVRIVCTHLESESPPSLRTEQMRQLLEYLDSEDRSIPTILGGDLNTWSFDKRDNEAQARLGRNRDSTARLLRPLAWEPLFEELTAHGYAFEDANDLSRGTYPIPGSPAESRLDWIALKGLHAADPIVIPSPHSERLGRPISDHHAIRTRCIR